MFGLFGKKDKQEGTKVRDKVLVSEVEKFNCLIQEHEADKQTQFIFWFDDTLEKAREAFKARDLEPGLFIAREANHFTNGKVIIAEHYPLASKEGELFGKLHLQEATVYSALDEPLFKLFGSDRIIQMMRQLGMKENEVVEHKMITQSIKSAQEKIAKKVLMDRSARSQQQWLEINFEK